MKIQRFWCLVIVLFVGSVVGFIVVLKMLSHQSERNSEITLMKTDPADPERVGMPSRPVKESTEIEKKSSSESITDEEWKQWLENKEFLAWLKKRDETSEEHEGVENSEDSDNSTPTLSLKHKKRPQSKPTEEVLDILDWPATGRYYVRDILRYRPEIIDDYEDPIGAKALFERMLAANPNATISNFNPRDPDSGVIVYSKGRWIPGHVYFSQYEGRGQ